MNPFEEIKTALEQAIDYEKEARDPNRIPGILGLLQRGWEKYPDWRLGQLFENIKSYSGKEDLFYVEDEMMEQLIVDYFDLDEV